MKLRELVSKGCDILVRNGIKEGRSNAEKLIMYIFDCDLKWMLLNGDTVVSDRAERSYFEFIDRRVKGEPLQYIITKQYFMGLEFKVNRDVLIPRQDTEVLVDEILKFLNKNNIDADSILDLCTGSGAIAISLAYYLNKKNCCRVYASDISPQAITIASANAEANGVNENITFLIGNMFEPLEQFKSSLAKSREEEIRNSKCAFKNNNENKKYERLDVIVSNPPYIPRAEINKLDKEVKEYEPSIALDGGEDGLDFYRIISKQAPKYLRSNGLLALEIGYDQARDVEDLLGSYFYNIQVIKDFAGLDRVILALKK